MPPGRLTYESLLTRSIRQLLRTFGIFHIKTRGGTRLEEPGLAEIIGIREGRFFAVKLASDHGALTGDHKDFLKRVTEAGGIAIVAKSPDDVIDGLGLRGRLLL